MNRYIETLFIACCVCLGCQHDFVVENASDVKGLEKEIYYSHEDVIETENTEEEQVKELARKEEVFVEFFLTKLTVWYNETTGKRIYVKHCRTALNGCESRVRYLVAKILKQALEADIDPFMAVSIAWHESKFNPFVVGPVGEKGIYQINPRAKWGKETRFVYDEKYRNSCKKKKGSCQEEVIQTALELFGRCLEKCGSTFSALGLYNTGKCGGNSSYSKKALGVYKDLKRFYQKQNSV